MTYVQRGAGLSAALTDASMLLSDDPSKSVLVGSFDEVTETVDRLRCDLGIYKSMPLGEGASAFVVSGVRPETTSYRLLGIATSSVPSMVCQCLCGFSSCQCLVQQLYT